jgi:hypothetical protein
MSLTKDLPAAFDRLFLDACEQIGCKPIDLLGVMFSESGCRSHAMNEGPPGAPPEKRYNAVGLIQFMPDTLRNLGYHNGPHAFRHIDACGQLPYVVAYYERWRKTGAPWDSAGRLYQATFVPATLAKLRSADDVLVQRGGFLGWAYSANAVFDANGDGAITIGELTAAIQRNARGARWDELLTRLGIERPENDGALIETSLDVQQALNALGFDPGPLDGIPGPLTRDAVVQFQAEHNLDPDGIAGPKTRRVLETMVRALSAKP